MERVYSIILACFMIIAINYSQLKFYENLIAAIEDVESNESQDNNDPSNDYSKKLNNSLTEEEHVSSIHSHHFDFTCFNFAFESTLKNNFHFVDNLLHNPYPLGLFQPPKSFLNA